MNEPLFKNSFIRDKKTATEIVKCMLLLTKLMKILYVVAAISLVFELVFFFIDLSNPNVRIIPESYYITIFTYVFPSLLLLLMFFVTKARNTPKSGTSEESFVITDNEIIWTSAGKKNIFAINDIVYYYNAKNYFVIIPNGMYAYIPAIQKDSFTLGTSDEFIEFLKSKGIKVQK